MDIFSYVVKYDDGTAPNPFGGFLTLATCKPKIRKSARVGDLIIGTGAVGNVGSNKLIYGGLISDVIPIAVYGRKKKYKHKRPTQDGHPIRIRGDNFYFLQNGKWKQRKNKSHTKEHMKKDLSGGNVLICKKFWYFGEEAVLIPQSLRFIIKQGPGHKRKRDPVQTKQFYQWLKDHPCGRHGDPYLMDEQEVDCELITSPGSC